MDKYRITNITKKPGFNKGPFKKGFFVDVKPQGAVRPMWVGHHVDVDEITPGMLAMQEKGYISIEPVKDLNVQIRNQVAKNNQKQKDELERTTQSLISSKEVALAVAKAEAKEVHKPLSETSSPSSGLHKEEMKKVAKESLGVNHAKVSGEPEDPLGGLEEAINPDGEPNFVVKSGGKRKARVSPMAEE